MPPTRLGKREGPLGKVFFGRTSVLQSCKLKIDPQGDDLSVPMSFCVREQGLTAWMAPAVRLLVSHDPWVKAVREHDQIGW